jgi:hypothetical protein
VSITVFNIDEVESKVNDTMQDKQEFADLCVHLVPELIEEIKRLDRRVKALDRYIKSEF